MKRPNVMLFTCHDLGRHLPCYGVSSLSTPNIDEFAARAIVFTQAFCVAPQCSPSRATLATGRYPHNNGVMGLAHGGFGWDLGAGERHVAELMAAGEYETHLFGLQHVTQDVRRLGFDVVHSQGTGPVVAEEVVGFLTSHASDRPFYAEINLTEPHRPFDWGGVSPDPVSEPYVPGYVPADEASKREFAALQGAIRRSDETLGVVLRALEASTQSADTVVILTTDHGIAMPRAKCTLYDPGIEVALLIRWPGAVTSGRTSNELISNVDVLPTILEVGALPIPREVQGRSFLPLVRGDAYQPRSEVYAEKTWHSYYDPMRAIRSERYKLIRNFETAFVVEVPGDIQRGDIFRSHAGLYSRDRSALVELYDLAEDPFEQRNLAGRDSVREVESGLDGRLWRWMEDTDDPLLEGPVASPRYRRALARD